MVMNGQPISELTGPSAPALPEPLTHARRMARGLLTIIGTWIQHSRQRRALANLDDHLLRDIGVSRSEATREIDKPFWR